MLITLFVSNFVRFNSFNDEHTENILFMLITLLVLNFERYNSFIKYTNALSNASFDDFKNPKLYGTDSVYYNLCLLNAAYNDKYGFYIFDRQAPEGKQLMTLDTFMRSQAFKPHGSHTYWIGGVLDYHF